MGFCQEIDTPSPTLSPTITTFEDTKTVFDLNTNSTSSNPVNISMVGIIIIGSCISVLFVVCCTYILWRRHKNKVESGLNTKDISKQTSSKQSLKQRKKIQKQYADSPLADE